MGKLDLNFHQCFFAKRVECAAQATGHECSDTCLGGARGLKVKNQNGGVQNRVQIL